MLSRSPMQAAGQIPARPHPPAGDERTLVAAVLAKDRKATAEFVSRATDWVYPLVRRRLMPRTEAIDDLMQEILLAAWQNLPGFRAHAGLRSWIIGIARHKVEDYYRRRLREADFPEQDDSAVEVAVPPMTFEHLHSAEREENIQRVLGLLPEAYRLALIWRYRDNKSAREMAALTGKTEKAMERLLARARENFRRRWTDVQP